MKLKEEFQEQIEAFYNDVIAPQSEALDIPSYDGDSHERFVGDDEPPF